MNGLIGLGGVLVLLLGVGTVLGLLDRRRFSMRWLVVAAVLVAVNDALLTGFYGRLPDMIGGAWNWQGKLLALAATLAIAALSAGALGLMIGFGVLTGVAMAGVTFVVVLGAVGRAVQPHERTVAFGIVTAGGSLGQFLVVPAAQGLLDAYDWHATLFILAALVALIIPLALGIAGKPVVADKGDGLPLKAALVEAARDRSYWLLNAGFFVCGFHIAFVGTHLPAYIRDQGLSAGVGAASLALIGLFNIAGSWLWGVWGSKGSKKSLLALLYGLRGVAIVIFLLVPLSPVSVLIFASTFGFLWLGTVPLTNGLVAQIYGVRHLSALGGIVFLSHQVGAFLGAWSAGWAFDVTGSYGVIWWVSIGLALLAAVANLPIREAPLVRPVPVPAE